MGPGRGRLFVPLAGHGNVRSVDASTPAESHSEIGAPSIRLSTVISALREGGCVFAEDEAHLLLEAARTPDELAVMLEERIAGRPLEHVLGWAEFCGLRIAVDPGVFVPRRRTEFLVEQAATLTRIRDVVVDLCCGSGALGAALARLRGPVELHAADIDPAAVRCARRNVDGRVYQGDLFDALPTRLRGRVNIVLANVPYVPSDEVELMPAEARLHEHRVALDGGADGLDLLRRMATATPQWLAPGGHLLIETSERQARAAADVFDRCGLTTHVATDDEREATVIVGARRRR
jgi:release factor glutamine methyltransferase